MGKKPIFTTCLLFYAFGMYAQTTDLARIEYLNFPLSKSDNTLSRYRALVQAPIPLDGERRNIFVVGLEYRYLDIDIKDTDDLLAFNNHIVSSTQMMKGYLGYVWKQGADWRIGIKAGLRIESDLVQGIVQDDIVYEVGTYFVKDKKKHPEKGIKPYRLIIGLTYVAKPGRWYPLPILNYYKQFRPNWTYTLGVPKTNVRHYLNSAHKDAIQAYVTLDNDFANIQQNFVPVSEQNPDGKLAESIQSTVGLVGLGYEHFFTGRLLFFGYVAHSVYNDFRLEDGNGKKIYKINIENSPYFRAGIKFKY